MHTQNPSTSKDICVVMTLTSSAQQRPDHGARMSGLCMYALWRATLGGTDGKGGALRVCAPSSLPL